jgi:hypothetical protein
MSNIPKALTLSINVTKIDKALLIPGQNGAQYLNIRLQNTPESNYGDDYLVAQQGPKGDDGKKIDGPILGNGRAWQITEGRSARDHDTPPPAPQSVGPASTEDLPF